MPLLHPERSGKGLRGPVPVSPEIRFWKLVDVRGPDECWPWQGSLDWAGYGTFKIWHKSACHHAHRALWILLHGKESVAGLVVCHKCHNRACVNPSHLYAGTSKQNTRDVIERGTFHPFSRTGVNNPRAVLTEKDVRYIRTSLLRNSELARELDVDPATVSRVRSGLIYASVGR